MDNRRNTIQRQIIFNAVLDLENHPSAEDVYNHIKPNYPSISLGTVYRNLNLLSENGKLLKVAIANSADRFDHNINSHYHIQCSKCKKLYDIDIPYFDQIDNEVSSKTEFDITNHHIIFDGICHQCQ